jgi:hypothetical protein
MDCLPRHAIGLVGNEATQLAAECDTVLSQLQCVPAREELNCRLRAREAEYSALRVANQDFTRMAVVGKEVRALADESTQLPLSAANYLTLGDRHALLVRQLTALCTQLADLQDFEALQVWGDRLNALKAADVSSLPNGSPGSIGSAVRPPAVPVITAVATAVTVESGAEDTLPTAVAVSVDEWGRK